MRIALVNFMLAGCLIVAQGLFGQHAEPNPYTRDEALCLVLPGRPYPRVLYPPDSSEVSHQRAYDLAMDRLAEEQLPDARDESAEAEVIRIAHDRSSNPQIYAELIDWYTDARRVDTSRRGLTPPAPGPKHISERYRLAWEYLVGRPERMGEAYGYGFRARQALVLLHDDASIPILTSAVSAHADYVHDAHLAYNIDTSVISELGSFPTKRGLDAMLRCVDIASKAQAGVKIQQGNSFDPFAFAKDVISNKYATADYLSKWQKTLEDYKADPAYRSMRPVLSAVLSSRSIHP